MRTTIWSNGSGNSRPIEALFDALAKHTLEPWLAPFVGKREGLTTFSGNFFDVSHVFRVETDDPELITRLQDAIAANMQTEAYRAAVEDRMRQDEERAERERKLCERRR